MSVDNINPENSQVIEFLRFLDERISRIEARLKLSILSEDNLSELNKESQPEQYKEPDDLELNIGEYWFANFGIVIMAIGMAFLLTLPFENYSPILPSIFGYSIVGLILLVSYFWRKSYQYVSNYLIGTGLVLLYFSTLRLFHFTPYPAFSNLIVEAILLLIAVTVCVVVGLRKKSSYLTAISLTMGCATAIIVGESYFVFLMLVLISSLFVLFYLKFNWQFLLIYGICILYFTHLVWAINNPFLGNPMQLVSDPKINIIFLLVYSLIFSLAILLKKTVTDQESISTSALILNVFGCFTLYQLLCLLKYQSDIVFYQVILFVIFFMSAIVFWLNKKDKNAISSYSLLAYVALSIIFISSTEIPDVYIFLIWQSIFVIGTAIWFQSKNIIVFNFLIFLLLFIAHLVSTETFGIISVSFGIVALISARLLNWQKSRLTLETEFIRNTYLAIAFFSIPYTLLKSLPSEYVGLSWLAVTIVYYILSILLKNMKYRWMAHLTMLGTIVFVFIIGFTSLDKTFLLINLFSLGLVFLIISLVFTNLRNKSHINDTKVGLKT